MYKTFSVAFLLIAPNWKHPSIYSQQNGYAVAHKYNGVLHSKKTFFFNSSTNGTEAWMNLKAKETR